MSRQIRYGIIGVVVASSLIAASPGRGSLDIQDRIRDRRAIEAIYWSHRVWPSSNPGHKPSLATVFPDSAIRSLVEDDLRKGPALARFWERPVTAEQVQDELNRMAARTRRPDMLRELFRTLGDDPRRVAEALALPSLEDRLLRSRYGSDPRFHEAARSRAERAFSRVRGSRDLPDIDGDYRRVDYVRQERAGPSLQGATSLDPDTWDELVSRIEKVFGVPHGDALRVGEVSPRIQEEADAYRIYSVLEAESDRLSVATVSWPKRSFEDWWREARAGLAPDTAPLSGRFVLPAVTGNCSDDTWSDTITEVPYGRKGHTAVWTGSEMIVWGGFSPIGSLNSGSRYNPATDTWTPTAIEIATPEPRTGHSAVWTGTEMIVWGGGTFKDLSPPLRSGGRYDPFTDTWKSVRNDPTSPTARANHAAVWTGQEMIVWGGSYGGCNCGYENTGGRYNPVSDTWTPTRVDATTPEPRGGPTAVWTGQEMIVWGGFKQNPCCAATHLDVDTGGRYDPVADTWIPISGGGGRSAHSAVWTGSEMIVWGGISRRTDPIRVVDITTVLNTGARYRPNGNVWTPTRLDSTTPAARSGHTAVWTGNRMILWGVVNPGAIYQPGPDTWTSILSNTTSPVIRSGHTAVWTGSEMIVWGGGTEYLNTGGRYDPNQDTWVPTPTNGAFPGGVAPQGPGVWTGSEMFLVRGLYDPATDRWRAISPAPFGANTGTPVWTGSEIILWPGSDRVGRYNPASDLWTTTTLSGAPQVGADYSTVWTGSEVIVWGGYIGVSPSPGTGGRFNPSTNAFAPTRADATAPVGRHWHTAVWTGTEMIIWGGTDDRPFSSPPYGLNSGGRYKPATDTWSPTAATSSVPEVRYLHTAIWTGQEMIVFGGLGQTPSPPPFPITGWIYNPASNSWRRARADATTPEGRYRHAAAWTGREMIVWGGNRDGTLPGTLDDGGRYDPAADSWTPTRRDSTTPLRRYDFTGVWTGEGFIVWGGQSPYQTTLNTGAVYCASSCVATTYFADTDGDGYGDPMTPQQSCTQPPGFVANGGDCSDANHDVWAVPGEARDLMLPDPVTLQWSPPGAPGGSTVGYDLLRSMLSTDFQAGAGCLVYDSGATTASDPELPPRGRAYFYLVRAVNACPGGESVLGTNSNGVPIAGRSCP